MKMLITIGVVYEDLARYESRRIVELDDNPSNRIVEQLVSQVASQMPGADIVRRYATLSGAIVAFAQRAVDRAASIMGDVDRKWED